MNDRASSQHQKPVTLVIGQTGQACHAQCAESMPTNVRDANVIWRCEECVRNKGQTDCSYARWVDGFEHTEIDGDTTVWREDNPNVGRPVTKRFGTKLYKGIVTRWMYQTRMGTVKSQI